MRERCRAGNTWTEEINPFFPSENSTSLIQIDSKTTEDDMIIDIESLFFEKNRKQNFQLALK